MKPVMTQAEFWALPEVVAQVEIQKRNPPTSAAHRNAVSHVHLRLIDVAVRSGLELGGHFNPYTAGIDVEAICDEERAEIETLAEEAQDYLCAAANYIGQ